MLIIVGIIIVIACVLGGYVLAHGEVMALWQPYEVLIICGAAFGAFVISNPGHVIKSTFGAIPSLLKGSKFNKALYLDFLAMMFDLLNKARKDGLMAIEEDVEEPKKSTIFKKYPKVLADHHVMDFITDYMRLMIGGNTNPFQLENLMDVELEAHHQEAALIPDAITRVSDALPGFGIVAAVLGIVITMASLGGPPEVIGAHVAAALVGTFLGILFAYGFVGPFAIAIEHMGREEAQFYQCIKVCLLASANGYSPQIAVEFARKAMYSADRPSFIELEKHVKKKK